MHISSAVPGCQAGLNSLNQPREQYLSHPEVISRTTTQVAATVFCMKHVKWLLHADEEIGQYCICKILRQAMLCVEEELNLPTQF